MTTILQLTDLHLLSDPEERLKDVPTRETLRAVIAQLRGQFDAAEAIVITGDCAHDEREATYAALREMLGDLVERCLFLPGNHDDRDGMRAVFGDRIPDGDRESITFSEEIGGWQLIGLDSQWAGEAAGRIDAAQIDWLDRELCRTSERPAALFLHHPPTTIGCEWLDAIRLLDPEPLLEVLAGHSQLQFVCAGHVHQEFSGSVGGTAFFTTPSTAIQFRSDGNEPRYEALPPGFRSFKLDGDSYQTAVVRVDTHDGRLVSNRDLG